MYNYDMPYTQMVPQHVIVGSPQLNGYTPVIPQAKEFPCQDENGMDEYEYNQQMQALLEGSMQNLSMSDEDDMQYPGQFVPPQFIQEPQMEARYGSTSNLSTSGAMSQGGIDFNSAPSRTVYLGNVPGYITPKELLDHVRSGVIESVRFLPEKMCAFISFLDESSALLFHSDATLRRLTIKDNDIKIGWGRNIPINPMVLSRVQRDGATRNVYIGNLTKDITEAKLDKDMQQFGVIDTIKIIPEKKIAFVHFCSIASAIKCVSTLTTKMPEQYGKMRIFYGKDRCAFITKTQQHNAAQYLGLAPGMEHLVTTADREFISSTLLKQSAAAAAIATTAGGANNLGNRTIYLGNLPKNAKLDEICNTIRGGLLEHVKYFPLRHVCFVTFIDPIAAAQFYAMSQLHGLSLYMKKIKVGWGKHSGPLSVELTLAVSSGASRNIYIGNIDVADPKFSEEALRKRFEEFGTVEQINYLADKNCVFVNFANISNAIVAIDKIKLDPDFKDLKINFGKDRCGNIPRQFVRKSL